MEEAPVPENVEEIIDDEDIVDDIDEDADSDGEIADDAEEGNGESVK